jgi:hypothetical protein
MCCELYVPGARPANSRTRMPFRGGSWCCLVAIAMSLFGSSVIKEDATGREAEMAIK